ncbi:unnamed protein product [Zymoseptoria tritici ST99CH_3D7]|uniref:F-box domain-containing protein n=1 Tax=Zymoseptoria tritici (strain ST99CH_3D7) TaxID=1276538 RepID=A0A1X7RPC6_ZYMT9|nr:unnamed protein product [Zymoseptoria tritici ST99CH_3D7]
MIAIQPPPTTLQQYAPLDLLPAELLLEIIPYTYTPHALHCLCLTCTRLNILVKEHEKSLVLAIKQCQDYTSILRLFPSLDTTTFSGLTVLHKRLSSLEDLHTQWLHITSHGPELHWLKGRWEGIHKAGLLLLHRLQDTGSYAYKVALINGLPLTSLACLLFKLISSIKILRIYGPDPINGTHAAGDILTRSDIELACEEMLLSHGPDFFTTLLRTGKSSPSSNPCWATTALTTEVAGMISRQLPSPSGLPKPPTLTSCLRRAFAARKGCHISQNVNKMWEILSSTAFDDMDEGKMVKVVHGEEVTGGMKRVF